jgi:hypothetical protein
VYIVEDGNEDNCYGDLLVDIRPKAVWFDLKSGLPGKPVSNIGVIIAVKHIRVNKDKVDIYESIPDEHGPVQAAVTFRVLCVGC